MPLKDGKDEILREELVSAYSQSLGREGAEKTLSGAIAEAGLNEREIYSLAEVLQICAILKTRPGLIGILGRCLENGFNQDRPMPFVQKH
jgi:hypothetical protein